MLRDTTIGGSIAGAVRGIGSQLSTTAPAALLVSASLVANILAGAVLMRLLRGRPYRSAIDITIFGFSGAVLLDVLFLGGLGSIGLFSGPVLAGAHVVLGVLGWFRCRPFVLPRSSPCRKRVPIGFWVFLAVAWTAPIILALASPVVPFRDLLHNHVAPVEFVRTYEWFPSLFTSPAAETGPTRQLLGFVGLLAAITKLTGLRAVLANAAFAIPLTVLFAITAYRVADRMFRSGAGIWAVAVVPLTYGFLRLPDSRGNVVAGVLGLISFLPLRELTTRRRVLVRSALIASVLYMHPLLGGVALVSHGAISVWESFGSENSDYPVWSLLGAVTFAIPQLLVVAGVDAPSWIILFAVPAGVVVASATANIGLPLRLVSSILLAALGAVCLLRIGVVGPRAWRTVTQDAALFSLLAAGFTGFLIVGRESNRRIHICAPVLAGVVVQVGTTFLPSDSVFWSSTQGEIIGKSGQNWIPVFLALGAAGALHWAWSRRQPVLRTGLVLAFLMFAALPLRKGTVDIEDGRQRAFSESLSISVHKAEKGAWSGWPDSRELVGESEKEIIAALRAEQSAGRMTRNTKTIQIAKSQQTWESTPIAAFAGAYVTHLSPVPEVSGHTMGGRLRPLSEVSSLLGPEYDYVLFEPADIPSGLRDEIVAAGYAPFFQNGKGEIFRFDR